MLFRDDLRNGNENKDIVLENNVDFGASPPIGISLVLDRIISREIYSRCGFVNMR